MCSLICDFMFKSSLEMMRVCAFIPLGSFTSKMRNSLGSTMRDKRHFEFEGLNEENTNSSSYKIQNTE